MAQIFCEAVLKREASCSQVPENRGGGCLCSPRACPRDPRSSERAQKWRTCVWVFGEFRVF